MHHQGYHDQGPYWGGPYGGNRPPPLPQGGGGRGRGRREEAAPGVSLLVRNLSSETTTSDLQGAFRRIGEIKDVYIPLDYHSKQPKGFAFIEYATHEQAKAAREEMNRFLMKGRELEVVFAQEKRKTPGEMRVRTDSPDAPNSRNGSFDRSSSFERHRRKEEESRNRNGSRDYNR